MDHGPRGHIAPSDSDLVNAPSEVTVGELTQCTDLGLCQVLLECIRVDMPLVRRVRSPMTDIPSVTALSGLNFVSEPD